MNTEAPDPTSTIQEIRSGGVGFEYAIFRFGEEAKLTQAPKIYLADLSLMSEVRVRISIVPDASHPAAQVAFIASVLDDRGARLGVDAQGKQGTVTSDQWGFVCVDDSKWAGNSESLTLQLPAASRHLEGYFVNLLPGSQVKVRPNLEAFVTRSPDPPEEELHVPGEQLIRFLGPIDSGVVEKVKIKFLQFGRSTRTLKYPVVFSDSAAPGRAKIDLRISVQESAPDNADVGLLFAAYDEEGNVLPLRDVGIEGTTSFEHQGCHYCSVAVTSRRFLSFRADLPRGSAQVRCYVVNLNPLRWISVKAKMNWLAARTPVWKKLHGDDATSEDHWSAALYASSPAVAVEVAAAQSLAIKYLRRQSEKFDDTASPSLRVVRESLLKGVSRTYNKLGTRQALARIYIHARNRNDQSVGIEELARRLEADDRDTATCLYHLSYDLIRTPAKARSVAAKMFKNGNVSDAGRLLKLASDAGSSKLIARLRLAQALQSGIDIPKRQVADERPQLDVAYVAAGTLPFLITGYAIRTHQMLRALGQAGISTACHARPGFPHDRPDAINVEASDVGDVTTDGVKYCYSSVQPIADDTESYIERVSNVLEQQFRTSRPAIVQAASNYMNSLPALIAARRAGVPFIYEVRGLWALSAASRLPGWEATERFKLDRQMEMLVAREADHVLAITRGVAEELIAGGLPSAKITLLPNAVDPDLFRPRAPDEQLAADLGITGGFTMVYAGSLTVYEGLDDLINAVAQLRQRSTNARLIIVGDGVARTALEKQVSQLDLEAAVTFIGRVTPDDISRYLSLADAVALPRKAFKVCKVVSPLKPFEAMAMGKPVVLTDLPALREIVQDGVTGLIAAPEDPDDLARTLLRLAVDPDLRARLGEAGRRWVVEERSWSANAELLKRIYAEQSVRLRNAA